MCLKASLICYLTVENRNTYDYTLVSASFDKYASRVLDEVENYITNSLHNITLVSTGTLIDLINNSVRIVNTRTYRDFQDFLRDVSEKVDRLAIRDARVVVDMFFGLPMGISSEEILRYFRPPFPYNRKAVMFKRRDIDIPIVVLMDSRVKMR